MSCCKVHKTMASHLHNIAICYDRHTKITRRSDQIVAGNFLLASARDIYTSGCQPIIAAHRNKSARCFKKACQILGRPLESVSKTCTKSNF